MMKRPIAFLLAVLMLFPTVLSVHAENKYNDTTIDWSEHTTHVYDDCGDVSCNVCGALRDSAHVYDNACDADCNVCGALRQVPDHVYDNVDDTECNICGFHREACNHQYDNACDATCNICGATREVSDHTYTSAVTTQPTCGESGVMTYTCSACGDSYTESIAALGHTWTDATCSAPKTCTVCGATEGEALEHSYNCVVTAQPTCTAAGVNTYTCSACGDSYTESIAALGHTWTDATCTAPKTCTVCGATEGAALEHNYNCVVTAQPTCTSTGVKTYTCSACGDSYTESIAALGHTWTDATCSAPKTCAVCGATEGAALEHTYDNACDANCNICGATRTVGDHIWENGACAECGAASPSKVTVTTTPKTTYGQEGATVKVTVKATGDGLKYQWYIRNATGKTYSKSSITTNTYSVKISDKSHNRRIYCIITDRYGNKVQTATVLVRRQATITKESATAAYAKKGAKVSVKITALGDGLKYTWYYKNDGASKYSKSSVTSAVYSTEMSSSSKNRRVYCVVRDKYGKTVQSKTFLLRESVSITTQPKTVTVAKNKTAKVTVKASGDGLKYTWYIKNAGASKYSKSSITKSTYSVKMTNSVKNRLVYCVVTDKYGKTVKTTTVKLKMK